MSMSKSTLLAQASLPAKSIGTRRLRVAVVCDFLEENWLSMDRCAEMLLGGMRNHHSEDLVATQVRPGMRHVFTRVPLAGGNKHARNADRLLNRLIKYPGYIRKLVDQFDVFHIVDHSYANLVHALPPERCVVTCHDLDTFRCVIDPGRDKRPYWFRSMAGHVLDGLRKAARVICVSNVTRNELLEYSLVTPEQVAVVPNCVHPVFSPAAAAPGDRAASVLLGEPADHVDILNVGSTIRRKRIEDLLKVFAGARRSNPALRLIRAGGDFTDDQKHLIASLGLPETSILVLPFLELETLAAIYRRAAVVVHTSEREGFGLPVVEALASGTPVLASSIPAFHEVGGSTVRFCPAGRIDLLQQALLDLLHDRAVRPELWATHRANCVSHARQFSWSQHIIGIRQIYEAMS
jgi:glycosyltransferase involved in cell wall biosynthesis